MTASVTRLDAHRPALSPSPLRFWARLRSWLKPAPNDANFPAVIGPFPPMPVVKAPRPAIDEQLLDLALVNGLTLRTRDGRRARLTSIEWESGIDPDTDPRPVCGELELVDSVTGRVAWSEARWFSDGGFDIYEHAWDLVSVETITCTHCGCDDLHACRTVAGPCFWVILDRDARQGVCSGCAGVAA